jgi:bacterioferritin-associated ferredoxin
MEEYINQMATELQTGERELPVECECGESIPSLMEIINKKNQELKEMIEAGEEERDANYMWDAKHGMI